MRVFYNRIDRLAGLTLCVLVLLLWPPSADGEQDCPVTMPSQSPVATAPPATGHTSHAWYGSENLAAFIPSSGSWQGMGPAHGYRDKFWWWANGYDASLPPLAPLKLTVTRLSGLPHEFVMTTETGGYNDDWNAMLIGMEFPTVGCWQVVGNYQQQQLMVVFLVIE